MKVGQLWETVKKKTNIESKIRPHLHRTPRIGSVRDILVFTNTKTLVYWSMRAYWRQLGSRYYTKVFYG